MEYSYQFFTGGFDGGYTRDDADTVLKDLYATLGPGDVVIGWWQQSNSYIKVVDQVHKAGKRMWLWLPVFSDFLDLLNPDPAISFRGTPQKGLSTMHGDYFRFVCPTSVHNINLAYDLYARYFAHLPFDGVMLDKIRHASFSGGIENGFGCFCDRCRSTYEGLGVDIKQIVNKIKFSLPSFIPVGVEDCVYQYEDPLVNDFYRAKAEIITNGILKITDTFIEDGLDVGLDTFSPIMAYLVGQDLHTLSKHVSFIKPMNYRITQAPAGMPFELTALAVSFLFCGDVLAALKRAWRVDNLFSEDSIRAQMASFRSNNNVMRPGFEVNIVPGSCDNTAEYVLSNAELYQALGFENCILSWNLLADIGDLLDALKQIK
jgi:hypothetical protein